MNRNKKFKELIDLLNDDSVDNVTLLNLIDSIPSDQLKSFFEMNNSQLDKLKSIYSDILEINFKNPFNTTFDTLLKSDVLIENIRIDPNLLREFNLKEVTSFPELINSFEDYIKKKNLSDGINRSMFNIFNENLQYLNYNQLNGFRRALLLSELISEI
jgi:hypothetical protein